MPPRIQLSNSKSALRIKCTMLYNSININRTATTSDFASAEWPSSTVLRTVTIQLFTSAQFNPALTPQRVASKTPTTTAQAYPSRRMLSQQCIRSMPLTRTKRKLFRHRQGREAPRPRRKARPSNRSGGWTFLPRRHRFHTHER